MDERELTPFEVYQKLHALELRFERFATRLTVVMTTLQIIGTALVGSIVKFYM